MAQVLAAHLFEILNLGHWDLFGIWPLVLEIFLFKDSAIFRYSYLLYKKYFGDTLLCEGTALPELVQISFFNSEICNPKSAIARGWYTDR